MVNLKIDWKLLLMGAFLVLFFLRECHHRSEVGNIRSDFSNMQSFHNKRDSANLAKLRVNAADSVKMSQTIVEFENLTDELKNELKGYKEGAGIVETSVRTVIERVTVVSYDTIPIDIVRLDSSNCEYADSLIKEFQNKKFFYNFKDDWLTISSHHTYNKLVFDTISVKNEFDVLIGHKKEKWYSRRYPTVELKSYNPYTDIVYVNNIMTKEHKTNYQRIFNSKSAYLFYGILAGFVLNNNLK